MSILKWLVVALLILSVSAAYADNSPAARKAAIHRQRHVIFNNDGDDAWLTDAPPTPEGFLSVRMDHVFDTGVDSVSYCCTEGFNLYTYDSKVTEVFTTTNGGFAKNRVAGLVKQGTDPLKLAVDICRKNNMEIFYELRMNDIHDNWWSDFFSKWKADHPEGLVGVPSDISTYPASDPRNVWTPVDFAYRPARTRTVDMVRDVVTRYDVDGIELDFLRHPCYFKETRLNQPVTPEHLEMITDMVRDIRRVVNEASQQKNKPILLEVRVMPTWDLNRHFGFDAKKWIDSGYIDLVSLGGGYDPFTMPMDEIIQYAHNKGIPVYGCLSLSGMAQNNVPDSYLGKNEYMVEAFRGAASNAWAKGVDGIMTFNVFPESPGTGATKIARDIWSAISDKNQMVGKDKLFCIDNLGWAINLGYMMGSVPVDGRFPAVVKKGESLTRVLPVGDNIPNLRNRVESLYLRMYFPNLKPEDTLSLTLNGRPLTLSPEKAGWIAGNITPGQVVRGDNVIKADYKSGTAAEQAWGAVEMLVRYRK